MSIEHYMYDDHPMLRRAATECICNMVNQEEVRFRVFEMKKKNKSFSFRRFRLNIIISEKTIELNFWFFFAAKTTNL